MKVILLTQWFDPEPTFKGLIFAKELMQRGFDVEVVTGFPNYPGGRLYDGYKISWRKKYVVDGVLVTRLALFPSHDKSAIKRVLNYVSFALSALIYCLFNAKKSDVIYAYHPPLTIGVVACLIKFCKKTPFVYDIQDMWPDTLKATGMINNDKLLSVIGKVAKFVYKHADAITVLSPGFKGLLIERGVDANKLTVIPNWCDERALSLADEMPCGSILSDKRFKIMFAGNMGKAQALDLVVEAAKILQRDRAPVVFILIGGGVERDRLKRYSESCSLSNIVFLDPVPMSQIGGYLRKADALLVNLKSDDLFSVTIPSKTQAYLFIGKPILMGVSGDAARIVREAGAGLVFEQESLNSFVESIHSLLGCDASQYDLMSSNARRYYLLNLSLKSGVDAYAKLFKQLKE